MVDINCYEPSLHGPLRAIQVANAADRLIFPHVDSCLAIGFLLANGQMVGGHVPMQMGANAAFDPAGNADRIIVNMLRLVRFECGASAINKLITVCPSGWVDYRLNHLNQRANPANGHLHLDSSDEVGGVDVYLDGPNQRLQILNHNSQAQIFNQFFVALGNGVHAL